MKNVLNVFDLDSKTNNNANKLYSIMYVKEVMKFYFYLIVLEELSAIIKISVRYR